jgi:hypothetical protein
MLLTYRSKPNRWGSPLGFKEIFQNWQGDSDLNNQCFHVAKALRSLILTVPENLHF